MTRRSMILAMALLLTLPLQEQEPEVNAGDEDRPAVAGFATLSDFDYLLGDWAFTATSKQWGRFEGRWSAVRLAEGQILDEYRIVDGEGETIYATVTLRNYNRHLDLWDLVGSDAGGGLRDVGTARRIGDEVHIEQTFGALTEAPSIWRIRYYAIADDHFSWVADVSNDGGKSWVSEFQTIEAQRIGPPRDLPPLTRPAHLR